MVTGRYPIRISFVLLLAFAACGGERSDQGGGPLAASEPTTVKRSSLESNGSACTANNECTSGFCTDGVCCNAACVGECVACNTSGSVGICRLLQDFTFCDDGNHCNTPDFCQAGTCMPGTTNVCNDPNNPNEPKYVSAIELGSVQGSWSYATGINNNHVVVGIDSTGGFRWWASSGMTHMPAGQTYASSINDDGVMAAGKASGVWLPCRYNPAVDTQPVCQLSEGRTTGINADGIATGWTVTGYFNNAPVTSAIRLGAGPIEILDPLPNPGLALNAVGSWIDGDGTVVGSQAYYGAMRWMSGRGTEVLHRLLPSGSNNNFLYDATFIRSFETQGVRSSEILGRAGWYDNGRQRAYRIKTNANGDVTAIDRLPMPSPYPQDAPKISSAVASNASGKIVGTVYDGSMSSAEAAFVYSDALGYSINLNDLIDPASDWQLLSASGINDSDEVVGYGIHNGTWRAFKLTLPDLSPCPAPSVCQLPGTRNILTGVCSYPPGAEGNTCGSGPSCTCQTGVCSLPTPKTCLSEKRECGSPDDGCGGTLNCGNCPTNAHCTVAGACVPDPSAGDVPTGVNICRLLLEDLTIFLPTPKCHSCGAECIFLPQCFEPGVCLNPAHPECSFLEFIDQVAQIISADSYHCSIDMTAEDFFAHLLAGRIQNVSALTASGAPLAIDNLFTIYVQILTAAGRSIPANAQAIIADLISPVYEPGGLSGFQYSDMQNVKVVSSDFPTAGRFLPSREAVTLGPVIILSADIYNALFDPANAGMTTNQLLNLPVFNTPALTCCNLTEPGCIGGDPACANSYFRNAIETLIHELVHVKQFRILGQEGFLATYLFSTLDYAARNPDAFANAINDFEREAFVYESTITQQVDGTYCQAEKGVLDQHLSNYSLPGIVCM